MILIRMSMLNWGYTRLFRMIADAKERAKIDLQFESFKDAKGLFGIEFAILAR